MSHHFSPKLVALLFLLFITFSEALAQESAPADSKPTHSPRVFDSKGNAAKIEDIFEAMKTADVVFIGETHDDQVTHRLEAELLRGAFARFVRGDEDSRRAVVLSLEMFERDVQLVLDEYLSGLISERHFLLSSRPWKNYQTDYRPLVEFARENKIPVVAANAPARYVSRVTQNGPGSLNALSPTAKSWLPPLPFAPPSETYSAKFKDFMAREAARAQPAPGAAPNPHAAPPPAHVPAAMYILDAQNLRDASMGHAIAEQLRRHKRALVLHVNGTFHSEECLGVPEHLARYREKARSLVVTALPASEFDAQKMSKLGDFIVLTGAPAAGK